MKRRGFQHGDRGFAGDNRIALCRNAQVDALVGAANSPDANFRTFHPLRHFRTQTRADAVALSHPGEPLLPEVVRPKPFSL